MSKTKNEQASRDGNGRLSMLAASESNDSIESKRVRARWIEAVKSVPRIAVIGITGMGKTSTINALFNTDLPVSDVLPGTKSPVAMGVQLKPTEDLVHAPRGDIIVVDMPGLGEDENRDPDVLAMYREVLPSVDVVLWIMDCRRDLAQKQRYVAELKSMLVPEIFTRIVFCLNRVDQFDQGEWLPEVPAPNDDMQRGISDHLDRVEKVFDVGQSRLVVYSAKWKYRIDVLLNAILEAVPAERTLAIDKRAVLPDVISLMDPELQRIAAGDK